MRNGLPYALSLTMAFASPALACTPDPGFSYDDLAAPGISVATAIVGDVGFEVSEGLACWTVNYSRARYVRGEGPRDFSVTTCADDPEQVADPASAEEGLDYLGMVAGAEVLVGVAGLRDGAVDPRYAVPSCWGPLHVDLRKMTDDEREDFLTKMVLSLERDG